MGHAWLWFLDDEHHCVAKRDAQSLKRLAVEVVDRLPRQGREVVEENSKVLI